MTSKQICVKRSRDSVAFKGGRRAERLGRFVFLLLIQVPSRAELQLRTGGGAIKTSGVVSQGCSRFFSSRMRAPVYVSKVRLFRSGSAKVSLALWMVGFSETLKVLRFLGDRHDGIFEPCDATV